MPARGIENPVLEAIRTRRSIRQFKAEPVTDAAVDQIIKAGLWAPSGKNNQPWKFAVLRDPEVRLSLAAMTHYGDIVREAPVCIAVFLDHSRSYDRTKDVQSAGACIQNMLLAIHSMGLGGVWLGEILRSKENVSELVRAGTDLELMAVVALGHPSDRIVRPLSGEGAVRDSLLDRVFARR
jgi:nitroreductase